MRRPRESLLTTLHLAMTVSLAACAAQPEKPTASPAQHGPVTNYQTPGSLRSFHRIGCVDVAELSTKDTPADIYPAVRKCLSQGDYQRGARLFFVAGAYGRFDALRVLDVSAHAAIPALQATTLGDLDETSAARFKATAQETMGSDHVVELCHQIRSLGPPTYYPTYMIQHGLDAFTGTREGLRRGFNTPDAWERVLTEYLNCSKGQ